METSAKLTAQATVEVVRIEAGADPRVVLAMAALEIPGISRLERKALQTRGVEQLRVGDKLRVEMSLDIPVSATLRPQDGGATSAG